MTKVEYFGCPLCGKTTPLKSFKPKIDLTTLGYIQIREGGGRGSGFKKVGQYRLDQVASHYPQVMQMLEARVHDLFARARMLTSISRKKAEEIEDEVVKRAYRSILGDQIDDYL